MSSEHREHRERRDALPKPLWSILTINGCVYDPNKWIITRENGVACIEEDGLVIDEPDDTGQSDAAVIRWGIIWCVISGVDVEDNGENLDACLAA